VASEVAKPAAVASFAIVVGLAPLCPVERDRHDHVPHHEFVEVHEPNTWIASGSSSNVPLDWMSNSSLDAADVAIRPAYLRQAEIAAMPSTSVITIKRR
jgi:hypothetical protein